MPSAACRHIGVVPSGTADLHAVIELDAAEVALAETARAAAMAPLPHDAASRPGATATAQHAFRSSLARVAAAAAVVSIVQDVDALAAATGLAAGAGCAAGAAVRLVAIDIGARSRAAPRPRRAGGAAGAAVVAVTL